VGLEKEETDSVLLFKCFDDAMKLHDNVWRNACRARGLREPCSLPSLEAGVFLKMKQNNIDSCLKLYKD